MTDIILGLQGEAPAGYRKGFPYVGGKYDSVKAKVLPFGVSQAIRNLYVNLLRFFLHLKALNIFLTLMFWFMYSKSWIKADK